MNILILGLGSIGRRHARTIRSMDPKACLYALRSGEGAPDAGVTDIHSIKDAPHPLDLAIVATPTHLHAASVQQVAVLNPFLFLEKPLALSLQDASIIIQTVANAGMRSYIGCHLRFHPCLQWVRASLQKSPQKIQSVHATCKSWLPDWQPGRDYRKSFRSDPSKSGGVHLELIHELDYLMWIFGAPSDAKATLKQVPELGIAVPAVAHYELRYLSFGATIDLSYASHTKQRTLEIIFDDTQWILDLLAFTICDGSGNILFTSKSTIDDVYKAQMQHVLDCATKGVESQHPVQEALETLRIALV